MNLENNADIEILSLLIGINKTANACHISKESIQKMFGKLRPENHKFFFFVKDCLLHIISKIGVEAASKKLEISVAVLKTIEKNATKVFKKAKKIVVEQKPGTDEKFKQEVVEFYNNCRSISKTSNNFGISKEKAIKWIISADFSFGIYNIPE